MALPIQVTVRLMALCHVFGKLRLEGEPRSQPRRQRDNHAAGKVALLRERSKDLERTPKRTLDGFKML